MSSTTSQPVVVESDRLLITKGYGNGARLWQITADADGQWQVSEIWNNPRVLRTKATSIVTHAGHAYGLSDGFLECVAIETGERRWKVRQGYGHGQVILVGELLLIQAESGDVALVEVNRDQFNEVARFSPLDTRTWNYPVVSGPYLLVRNDREIACYRLPLRGAREETTQASISSPSPQQENEKGVFRHDTLANASSGSGDNR